LDANSFLGEVKFGILKESAQNIPFFRTPVSTVTAGLVDASVIISLAIKSTVDGLGSSKTRSVGTMTDDRTASVSISKKKDQESVSIKIC
jgi:hypothetical protein